MGLRPEELHSLSLPKLALATVEGLARRADVDAEIARRHLAHVAPSTPTNTPMDSRRARLRGLDVKQLAAGEREED